MASGEINNALDHNAGKAQAVKNLSLSTFVSSLSAALVILAFGLVIFILFKDRYEQIYQPRFTRSYTESNKFVIPRLPSGPFHWLRPVITLPDQSIYTECGIDAYLATRYLMFLLILIAPMIFVILPVLMTLNSISMAHPRNRKFDLNQFSWTNVDIQHSSHLWAHFGCALATIIWVCFLVARELIAFVSLRERHIVETNSRRVYLVLLTDVPSALQSSESLFELYKPIQGALLGAQVYRNLDNLVATIGRRDEKLIQLEISYTRWLTRSVKCCKTNEIQSAPRETTRLPLVTWLPPLPLFGKKVDKISQLEREVAILNRKVSSLQQSSGEATSTSSALLQFNDDVCARIAARTPAYPAPLSMRAHYIDTAPLNVLWDNFGLRWWSRTLRHILTTFVATAAVLLWSVPIALVGLLSQLEYLRGLAPWLSFLDQIPDSALSILQGVLPPVLTAVLLSIFPAFIRCLITQQRLLDKVEEEVRIQRYYFIFLFLHLFLTVSVASGLTAVLAELLENPRSASTILAQNLPKSGNYFMSYILMQGFTGAALTLTQVVTSVRSVMMRLFDHTPRQKVLRSLDLSVIQWGILFPTYTNLACIVIIYATTVPLIIPLACATFFVLWATNRYSLMYVASGNISTRGEIYIQALRQLLTGVYVMEIYLIGLFSLRRTADGGSASPAQAILMAFTLFLTIVFHRQLSDAIDPLLNSVSLNSRREVRDISQAQVPRAQCLQHPALDCGRPIVWIPNDSVNQSRGEALSDRQIKLAERIYGASLPFNNKFAALDEDGALVIQHWGLPPNYGVHLGIRPQFSQTST